MRKTKENIERKNIESDKMIYFQIDLKIDQWTSEIFCYVLCKCPALTENCFVCLALRITFYSRRRLI